MKHLLIAFTAFILAASASQAQTSATAASGSNSSAGALSASEATIIFPSAPRSTTQRLEAAPPVQAPSMGSGHPCAYSPFSGSISIIGGGASGGGMQIDEACLLAQMGQGEAALIMIAKRDEGACKALRQTGRIASTSLCTDAERRAAKSKTVSSKSTSAKPKLAVKCTKRSDGAIVPQVSRAVAKAYSTAQIKAACK